MRYSVPQLVAFAAISLTLTAGTLLGFHYLLEPALTRLSLEEGAEWVNAFFFERSKVQWCTLSVFFFALTIVASRVMHHVSVSRSLRAVAPVNLSKLEVPARVTSLVSHRIGSVRACLAEHGRNAAVRHAQELSRRDEGSVEQVYALLGSAVQVMLALGFFGTVWGISRSMFGSFGQLSGAAPEGITEGLRQFTAALSTALDTTVLALVCGILASVAITVTRWAEAGGLAELEKLVREKFDLVAESQADASGQMAHQLAAVVTEGAGQLREIAGQTTQALREEAGRLARTELERARQAFESGIADAVRGLEEHGGALRKEVADGLAKVEQGLHRVPQISIRYPQATEEQDVQVRASTSATEHDEDVEP